MAIVRRATDLDATWSRGWTADTFADLASIVGSAFDDAHRGDVAFVVDEGIYYTFRDDGTWEASGGAANPVTVGVTVDGGGAPITAGHKGYIQCPIAGTITSWSLLADQAGDVEFDIMLDPLGSFPPTTSIVASAPPELVAADSDTDSTLTGWSTAVAAGDVFGFEVVSAATIARVTLQLTVAP